MEIEYLPEGNQDENETRNKSRKKLYKKTQLGKKRVLNPEKKNINDSNNININMKSQNDDKIGEEIILRNEPIHIDKNVKDNNASFLIKTIIKAFYLSLWKRQIKAMKYYSRRYNPQRINFKKLIKEISSVIKQHKFEYFNEIYENMNNLPLPKNVNHDYNYGKLKIINKERLFKQNKNLQISKNESNNINFSNPKKNKKQNMNIQNYNHNDNYQN